MRHSLPVLVAASLAPLACFRNLTPVLCDDRDPPCTASSGSASESSSETTASSESSSSSSSSSSGTTTSSGSADASGSTTGPDPATDSSTAATSTTTGPATVCGDGEVQPDEECDGGAACNDLCKRDRVVFITSWPGFNAGELQGLAGADNYCTNRAGMAGLPQHLKFRAFLSDSQHDVADRMFHSEGRYVLIDGTVVADDWDALLTEPLQHPINRTEKNEELINGVWTGTEHGTGKLVPSADNCADWTSNDPSGIAYFGDSNSVDANWIYSNFLNPTSCVSGFSIYCFEQQ